MYDYIPKNNHTTLELIAIDKNSLKYLLPNILKIVIFVIIGIDLTLKAKQIASYNFQALDFRLLGLSFTLYLLISFFNKTSEINIEMLKGLSDLIYTIII